MNARKFLASLRLACVCLLPAVVGCQALSQEPAARPSGPEAVAGAPLGDPLLQQWGAEIVAWNNPAAIGAYAKIDYSDSLVRQLYAEYQRVLVTPPALRGAPVVFAAGEKERLQARALAWKLQNMLLAMPDPAFARYGVLLGGMRQILFLGQKYIPEVARQNYSHCATWWTFHRDWTARTDAAYAELFPGP